MYSSLFNGWIGKIDKEWAEENREKLFLSLINYYQHHITSGQKLFVGYDCDELSRYIAMEAAELFSKNGIPVFISNRPLATSMLQVVTKERYGCGSIAFVHDDYPFPCVGLKASNMEGKFISNKDLLALGELKKQKKQPIDWFDPLLNLKNYLETNLELDKSSKVLNSLVWNSIHSPLSPILEEIFVEMFSKTSIDAYTLNSYENLLIKDKIYNVEIQEQVDLTNIKMNEFLCHYGVTTSPDLCKIDVLEDKKGIIQPVSFEDIVNRIIPYIKSNKQIVISDELSFINKSSKELKVKKVAEKSFLRTIEDEEFSLAVDGDYNIYLQNELFPNQFATLFCLYHSLLCVPQQKKHILNYKKSTQEMEI